MAHSVEMVDGTHARVRLFGDVTKRDLEESRSKATSALAASNCNRILVEGIHANRRVSVTEDHQFVSGFSDSFPPGVRIALVTHPDEVEALRLVENVAQNRGVNLLLFLDEAEALAWLLD